MRSIIRHNGDPPALPDLRNLGTTLRILLAVNGAAVMAALVREPRWEALPAAIVDTVGAVQPPLLLALALLWALAPWLARQPYRTAAFVDRRDRRRLGDASASSWSIASFRSPRARELRHLVFALAAVVVLLAYFRLRARALSPAITEARLQALQARIRPHFLFNSINGVLSLVRSDPRRAEDALHDLADLFRVLMRDNRDLTPLADEVTLCRQYLDLEKLRLGERLVVDWNVKSMPDDALVPPLFLQPLLENAVYHGIEPCTEPGTITINIFLTRGEVHAILRNPYRADGGPSPRRQQDGAREHPRASCPAFRRRGLAGVARSARQLRGAHPHAVSHRIAAAAGGRGFARRGGQRRRSQQRACEAALANRP